MMIFLPWEKYSKIHWKIKSLKRKKKLKALWITSTESTETRRTQMVNFTQHDPDTAVSTISLSILFPALPREPPQAYVMSLCITKPGGRLGEAWGKKKTSLSQGCAASGQGHSLASRAQAGCSSNWPPQPGTLTAVHQLCNRPQHPWEAIRVTVNYVSFPFLCPVRVESSIASGSHGAEGKTKSSRGSQSRSLWIMELTLSNSRHRLFHLTSLILNPQPQLKNQEYIYIGWI